MFTNPGVETMSKTIDVANEHRLSRVVIALAATLLGTVPGPVPTGGTNVGIAAMDSVWSASGPGMVTVGGNGVSANPSMSYRLEGPAVHGTQTWEFGTVSAAGGPARVRYRYAGHHAFHQVRVFIEAHITNEDGTTFITVLDVGPANCCRGPSGSFRYEGEHTFITRPGNAYGFRFGGSNFDAHTELRGTFSVTPVGR